MVVPPSPTQHFQVLTGHKDAGRQWVTREQYIRFFIACYEVLYPDNEMTEAEKRASLEVSDPVTVTVEHNGRNHPPPVPTPVYHCVRVYVVAGGVGEGQTGPARPNLPCVLQCRV